MIGAALPRATVARLMPPSSHAHTTPDINADALAGIRAVVEAIRLINLSTELPAMLEAVLDGVASLMPYDAAGVSIVDPETGASRGQLARGYTIEAPRMEAPFSDKGLVGRVMATGRAMLVRDLQHEREHLEGRSSARTELLVPLVGSRDRVLGAINVESDRAEAYSSLSLELLNVFASGIAGPLEAAMLQESILRRRRAEHELQVARHVMEELLPHQTPRLDGFDIAGIHETSHEVGGDYYELIPLRDDRWGLAIADVVGKGVAAALLVAAMRASLSSMARHELALRAILRRANHFFHESVTEGKFVTLFYAVLDVPTRRLIFVNAGHMPPVLVRASGEIELLEEGGVPLGLFEDPRYKEGFTRMRDGDTLVLYTDGITEAADAADEPYGLERMVETVRRLRSASARAICDAVIQDVREFSGTHPADDQTLLVLRAEP